MNIALDTNAYSDFMRGDGERVRIVRAANSIAMPIVVLGELRAGFAAGNLESANAANLQRFLAFAYIFPGHDTEIERNPNL